MDSRMRRLIAFPCAGDTLLGTLDEGSGTTGLLIVSGGNEIRMGAHRGMAMLAPRVAAELGAPVFRFDRRGIGDSTGENRGFAHSAEDIAAAAATFAAETRVTRVVAFGNCDAATALALFHSVAGIDALLLANPWVIEEADDLPPAAAIRSRYAERMRDPRQWLRLVTGGVNIVKLAKGLGKLSQSKPEPAASLASRFAEALGASGTPAAILLARGDNTAIAFAEAWHHAAPEALRQRAAMRVCETASHSFGQMADKEWLFDRIREALFQERSG
jgi:exosortase A-associated hydrolase 1